jgi:hypothetical protein
MRWTSCVSEWAEPLSFKSQLLIAGLGMLLAPTSFSAQRVTDRHCTDYLYGLYYGGWDDPRPGVIIENLAFVISPDGKPIPPKADDSEAPTLPGFYVREKRYEFAHSKFSARGFSFRTKEIEGTVFSFEGRFGCEPFDEEVDSPYLQGELKETRKGHVIRKKNIHFGHAVMY